MIELWNGILMGLALAILVGPILFSLIQRSIEQGIRAGLWVALGIWVSDLLFIGGIMFGVTHIAQMIESPLFEPILGVLGGLVLIGIGVGMFISKPAENMETSNGLEILSSKWKLCLEGFLLNTINPFSVIFWTSLITTKSIETDLFSINNYLFFGSILGTIVITDVLKVILAKKISTYLQPKHILRMRKISGIALFLFGIVMMIRVTLV
ncbi:MAG: LysE family translocator [Saprospiraceae bacterium]